MLKWQPFAKSLRARIVFATVLVEAMVVALLLGNSLRLTENASEQQLYNRLYELDTLVNIALSQPLAQMDYDAAQQILEQSRRSANFEYLVLLDQSGKVVASVGWGLNRPLPEIDMLEGRIEFSHLTDNRLDIETPIQISGQLYGKLRYGLSTQPFVMAQERLLQQNLLIAGFGIVISALLLAGLGMWLTRHLVALTEASRAITEGDFEIKLDIDSEDEAGRLATAFNAMAETVRSRIQALRESETKFSNIADYTYDWESWVDPNGKLIWVNPSVKRLTGFSPEECMRIENFPFPLIVEEDRTTTQEQFQRALGGETGSDLEFRIQHRSGNYLWVACSWQPIYAADGTYKGIRSSIRDISERKENELVLRHAFVELQDSGEKQRAYLAQAQEEKARLGSLLSAMNLGIIFVSPDNRVEYYNPAFLSIWGIKDASSLVGQPARNILSMASSTVARSEFASDKILEAEAGAPDNESLEIPLADGRILVQLYYPVRDNENKLIGHLWIYEDVTRERQTAQQLIYLAERDSLTGLYNRHRFQDELARMITEADRRHFQGALIFFDLDEFKYVNDTFGHGAGDTMLIRVAGEVGTLIRRNEIFSRLGGDEFAILAPDISTDEVHVFAERVVQAIAQIPFRFEGQSLRLTCSLGIAFYPLHASNAEELIAHADAAMYQAKEAGKNAWRIYRPELDTSREMVNRLSWNERISHALDHNLFQLHYQGVYRTHNQTLSHLEVLVRMVDQEEPGKLIYPGLFIPVAERSGKILDIDRWVIRQTIATLAQSDSVPPMAVNISGRSFDDPTLPQYIAAQLREFQVNPKRLFIELTETAAVSDMQDAERFIEALHKTGCVICMDDFGTGFSSFAYLKHLQADILKIDGMFIRNLPHDRDNQVFVKAIVDVARGMHKATVAEYVENAEILEMLKGFGVDMVQGYHLDIPRADHPALAKR